MNIAGMDAHMQVGSLTAAELDFYLLAGDSHYLCVTPRDCLAHRVKHLQDRRPCKNGWSFGYVHWSLLGWSGTDLSGLVPCRVLALHATVPTAGIQVGTDC